MSTKPASIVQLLDNSGSMSSKSTDSVNTNLQLLQTDTNTFMSIMQGTGSADNQLGQVGLVKFNSSASTLYGLNTLDASSAVLGAAIGKVNGLSVTGLTNITDAISKGHTMLGSATSGNNKAMVLFSDGMWNEGGNPITNLPTDIPIYTIGYGTSSQLSYLSDIATNTSGQYHITGDPGILATYYNDIIQDTNVAATVVNAHQDVTMYGLFTSTANVPSGEPWHLFVATWADNSLNYAAGTPGPGQIQVVLNNPSGGTVTPDVVDSPNGSGYAILTVNNPVAGTWKLTTHPSSFSGVSALGAAHGVFTKPDNLNASLIAQAVNSPLYVSARISDDGESLQNVNIDAHSKHPVNSHEELLDTHAEDVNRIKGENDFHEDMNADEAALRVLNGEKPELQIYKHATEPAGVVSQNDGEHLIEVQNHKAGVPNTVYVTFTGTSHVSGKSFQRTKLLSVIP